MESGASGKWRNFVRNPPFGVIEFHPGTRFQPLLKTYGRRILSMRHRRRQA
jgi:hypothetical protein